MIVNYFAFGLIVCYTIKVDAISNGDLRLVGGDTYKEGRVEMYYNSEWGTVCDDSWDNSDARVVCQQLGFGYYGTALNGSSVTDGSGNIWLDELGCSGTEIHILNCSRNSVGDHNCGHSDDAGVRCYETPPRYSVRLVSGSGLETYEGRVEVYHNSQWKSVCDDGWNWEESDVVCKSLGYSLGAQKYYHGARYGRGTGEILLDNVECTGSENSLLHCKHNGIHIHNCGHHEDIGVKCAVTKYITGVHVVNGSLSSTSCPSGYEKIDYDLNRGAKGDYIYLCYTRGTREAITGLNVFAGGNSSFPIQPGYTKISMDLNEGAGGSYVYLAYTKIDNLPPIKNVTVVGGNNHFRYPPSTWVRIDTNCNEGTRGDFIYISYEQSCE